MTLTLAELAVARDWLLEHWRTPAADEHLYCTFIESYGLALAAHLPHLVYQGDRDRHLWVREHADAISSFLTDYPARWGWIWTGITGADVDPRNL